MRGSTVYRTQIIKLVIFCINNPIISMLFSKNNCIHIIRSLSYQFNNNYSYKLSFKLFFFLHIDNYAKKIIYATRTCVYRFLNYLIIRVRILIHCNAIVVICIALVVILGFMISVALSERYAYTCDHDSLCIVLRTTT